MNTTLMEAVGDSDHCHSHIDCYAVLNPKLFSMIQTRAKICSTYKLKIKRVQTRTTLSLPFSVSTTPLD